MTTPQSGRNPTRPRRAVVAQAQAPAPAPSALMRRQRPQPVAGTERTAYEDETGRIWTVLVPLGHPEQAELGLVVGPPDTSSLGLPEPQAVRLHNELQARGLLTAFDLRGREREVFAALQAALHVDVSAIIGAYHATEKGA